MTPVERVYAASRQMDTGCLVFMEQPNVERPTVRGEYVYRLTYAAAYGPIPNGLHVHHICKNPRCVAPAHLELLDVAEHARRHGQEHAATCRSGHSMSDCILVYYRSGVVQRRCRTCYAANRRRLHDREKQERAQRRAERPKPPKTHCKRGHPWTPANVTVRSDGYSYCKPCAAELMRAKGKRHG